MFVAAAIGIVLGALFLFAPIHGYCMGSTEVFAVPPGQTPAPSSSTVTTCGVQALWQRQPIFPLPFFAVLVWSLAPGLGYLGARMRATSATTGPGTLVMLLALVVEMTVFVSFGAAPFFVPFVFVPQLIASVLALRTA
ncbi:MAG TPA: hypothetical protein VI814_02715 [Candidatus Limnocylindria bacterium]